VARKLYKCSDLAGGFNMSDYKERFEKWQKDAKQKFEDIDKQLGIKDKIEEGTRVVSETAKTGAKKIKTEAEKTEVGKQAVKATEETLHTAENLAKEAWKASGPLREAAGEAGEFAGEVAKEAGRTAGEVIGSAGEKAGEMFDETRDSINKNAKRVSQAVSIGAGWTRTFDSAYRLLSNAANWVAEDPLRAATTGVSMAVGAGLGVVFTGVSSHWLFNSALPVWSVKKVADEFDRYLKSREEKIARGRMTEAEAERIRFERDIARRIGAPLLGSFAFASGAVMMTNVLNPKVITGFPIDLLLGGNPMLEGVWFFGNGMVCFKTSYDFFMIALEGQEDVERMVREIKGLLPEGVV
jgi:cell division septum initiation protein DivIVA